MTVDEVINAGSGIGEYGNQVVITGTTSTGQTFSDLSDAGTDPDSDDDGNPSSAAPVSEDDPTAFTIMAGAIVGAAKEVTVSGNEVTIDIVLENFGSEIASNISVTEDLDRVFGAGNYSLVATTYSDPGGFAFVDNVGFDGSSDRELLGVGSTLTAGGTGILQIVVDVTNVSDRGLGFGVYENQAVVRASDPAGLFFSDLSGPGTDPDPNGNGDPGDPPASNGATGEDDPTGFFVGDAAIGAALNSFVNGNQITYDYTIENLGDVPIELVGDAFSSNTSHDLNAVFGSGNFTILTPPALIEGPSSIELNSDFDGIPFRNSNLLSGGTLQPSEFATIRVVVDVTTVSDQGNGFGVYQTNFTAGGLRPGETAFTDLSDVSDAGIITDTDGNGSGGDPGEGDPTISEIGVEVAQGVAKDVSINATEVTFDYFLENLGAETLTDISLPDNLDAVFGAGNYFVFDLFFVDAPGTLGINFGFDGSGDTQLIAPGGSLDAGDTAQLRLLVNVSNVVDQGPGEGRYRNQVVVTGTAPNGVLVQDRSDSGSNPDPNDNGNPADAGEGDPTLIVFNEPSIGVGKEAFLFEDEVTFAYTIGNFGNTRLGDLALSENLDDVFGASNYTILSGPTVLGAASDLVVNTLFDGSLVTDVIESGSLLPNESVTIELIVQVDQFVDLGDGRGVYSNQVRVDANDPRNGEVSDLSALFADPDFDEPTDIIFPIDEIVNPFERLQPLGSLISVSRDNLGPLYNENDTRSYSIFLEAGEKLAAELTTEAGVTATVQIVELSESASSPAAGETAFLPPIQIPADGIYTVQVSADAASDFDLDLFRNTSIESMVGDSADGNELAIDDSLISLGVVGRYAVSGKSTPTPAQADILLISDTNELTGVASLLAPDGHIIAEVVGDFATGNASLLDLPFLQTFDFVVWGASGNGSGDLHPQPVYDNLEAYIQSGGHLLVTGYDTLASPVDTGLADLVRSTTTVDTTGQTSFTTQNLDHFVLNGPAGDFRNTQITPGYSDWDGATADTAAGAISLATHDIGTYDAIIYTDLPGVAGSVGYWTGGDSGSQPTDGKTDWKTPGPSLDMLRNWAFGVVTSTVENGSFETGDFTGWTTATSGTPFVDWTVSAAAAGGSNGLDSTTPQDGTLNAWNGFDGAGPLEFTMYQDVDVPSGGQLSWQYRAQWNFTLGNTANIGRDFIVEVLDPNDDSLLDTLYTFNTGTQATNPTGDTGWLTETANLSAFAGQTVRLMFREVIPETNTGPGQLELDAISLVSTPLPDVDEYTVDLTGKSGQPIDVVMAGQNGADFSGQLLELLDTDGITVLATATSDPLGVTATNYDLGILDFSVPGDGVYTIRLTSLIDGAYDIVVTDPLTFDTEPNDDASADPIRDLTTTRAALGYLSDGGTYFSADFSDNGTPSLDGFTIDADATSQWHLSTGRDADAGHSEPDSLYFGSGEGSAGGGTYNNNASGTVTSPPIDLSAAPSAELQFSYFLDTESCCDPASVNISTDGGTTFTPLIFALPGTSGSFVQRTIDLSAFIGSQIQLQFAFSTDGSVTNEGWYLDDVVVASIVPKDTDNYTVTLAAGQRVTVSATALFAALDAEPQNSLDAQLTVIHPDGTTVVDMDQNTRDGKNPILSFIAPVAGNYTIFLEAEAGSGEYLLELSDADFNPLITQSDDSTDVSEDGTVTDSYEVMLGAVPDSDVVITVTPDVQVDLVRGPGTAIELTFTPSTWDSPQTVNVTATDDAVVETLVHSGLITHTMASSDAAFDGNSADLTVNVTDDDFLTPVIASTATDPTNLAVIPITVNFGAAVTLFDGDDLMVAGGAIGNFNDDGGGLFSFQITPDIDGTITVDIAAAAALDAGDKETLAATQFTIDSDQTAPTTVITGPAGPINTEPFQVTITFSEIVFDFVTADVTVGNGSVTALLDNNDGTFTATIDPTADGNVTVDVAAGVASDAAGNGNLAAVGYSIAFDTTPPTPLISGPTSPTNLDPFAVTIDFGEVVATLDVAEITVTGGTIANLTDNNDGTFFANINPTADGTVTVDIAAGVANDTAGNANLAAVQFSVVVDTAAPTPVITGPSGPTNVDPFQVTINFAETVVDFVLGDIIVGGGSATALVDNNDGTFTATIDPSADGTVTVDVAAGVTADTAGNANPAATQFSVAVDTTAPTAVISGPTSPTNTDPLDVTISFGETVIDFVQADVTVAGGSITAFVDNSDGTFTVTIDATTDGTVTVDVAAAVANDTAGNANLAAVQLSIVVDTTAPSISPPADLIVDANVAGGAEQTLAAITAFLSAATATDDVDPNPTISNDAPDLFPAGETTVTFTATDALGNQQMATAIVKVFFDYGDAPTAADTGFANSYPVTLAQDGARHAPGTLVLGSAIDSEIDGQPDIVAGASGAGGDDGNGDPDDEDGVVATATLVAAVGVETTSSFRVTVSADGKLDAWIDFDRNGSWDADEQILDSIDVFAGETSSRMRFPPTPRWAARQSGSGFPPAATWTRPAPRATAKWKTTLPSFKTAVMRLM